MADLGRFDVRESGLNGSMDGFPFFDLSGLQSFLFAPNSDSEFLIIYQSGFGECQLTDYGRARVMVGALISDSRSNQR